MIGILFEYLPVMLAQRLAGGETIAVKNISSISDKGTTRHFESDSHIVPLRATENVDANTHIYLLRYCIKHPHIVSWFHSKNSLAVEMEHLYSLVV